MRVDFLKKTYVLHLDAIVVIALLFVLALGMNFFQYRVYAELVMENKQLQMKGMENELNLSSMQNYIDQLKAKSE